MARLALPDGRPVELVDLPGTYSLDPSSPDEQVTRDVVIGRQEGERLPDALVVVAEGADHPDLETWSEEIAKGLNGTRLGEAAALRFTVTRLHDRIFHDPANLVTPKDPAVFLRRMDHWRATEPA